MQIVIAWNQVRVRQIQSKEFHSLSEAVPGVHNTNINFQVRVVGIRESVIDEPYNHGEPSYYVGDPLVCQKERSLDD